jgi:hypothetical protein
LTKAIEDRGAAFEMDLISGEKVDEWTRGINKIESAYASMAEEAAKIADGELRAAAQSDVGLSRMREIFALRKKMSDEANVEAEKKRAEWLERAREAAKGIADQLRQAAGIVLGRGAEAFKAVQEASRNRNADRVERGLLERSGAMTLDDESKRLLREMRDYLLTLANAETVPI